MRCAVRPHCNCDLIPVAISEAAQRVKVKVDIARRGVGYRVGTADSRAAIGHSPGQMIVPRAVYRVINIDIEILRPVSNLPVRGGIVATLKSGVTQKWNVDRGGQAVEILQIVAQDIELRCAQD